MKYIVLSTSIAAFALGGNAAAQGIQGFKGEAELGYTNISGNSDAENLVAKAKGTKEYDKWRHNAMLEATKSSSNSVDTAERYLASYKADYKLSDVDYAFGQLNYEKDKFSGYDNRISELLGYGRDLYKTETLFANAEISAGARQSKLTVPNADGDDSLSEAVVKLLGHLNWKISDTTDFDEVLTYDIGDESRIAKSVSGLKTKINTALAMKVTYTITNNSDPVPGKTSTDRETNVTLVYSF
ncbi:MAG: DUF481 domain-containing protein [Pseudomonadota bacterium]